MCQSCYLNAKTKQKNNKKTLYSKAYYNYLKQICYYMNFSNYADYHFY